MRSVTTYKVRRLNRMRTFWILVRFYAYYNVKTKFHKYLTVVKMLLKREKRLYYLYSTKEVVEVTWRNYIKLVKVDGAEFGLIKITSANGEQWCKGERF